MTTAGTETTTDWAKLFLTDLRAKFPKIQLSTINIDNIKLWLHQEQNSRTWAANRDNPLGVRNGPGGQVVPYSDFAAGAAGTASTLENGYYDPIIADLEQSAPTTQFATDVINSPWSGKTYRERGLSTFLSNGGLDASAPADGSATGFNLGNGFNALNPLNIPKTAGSAVFNAAKPFIITAIFVLFGLGIIGLGVFELAGGRKTAGDVIQLGKAAA